MSTRKANLNDENTMVAPAPMSIRASLPTGWEWSRLGDICRTTSGGTPSRKNLEYFAGAIPWVKSGELPDGIVTEVEERITEEAVANSSAKLFPAGTLLIALYGATVGKLGILKEGATTNQAVCAIFPPENLDTKYLFWYLRSVRSDLVDQAIGGAQPNISQGILRTLPIPVAPPDQQKHIVAEIEKQFSRLDEAVANLKRVKANLKRYKAAVLKAAVEGRLVETEAELARREGRSFETGAQLLQRILESRRSQWQGKGRYKEPAPLGKILDGILPDGWAWASVDQLTPVHRPCAYGVLQPGDDVTSGVPLVRVGDINDGNVRLDNLKKISPSIAAKYPRTQLEGGEVLVTIVGAIGRTAVAPQQLNGANVARAVAMVPVTQHISARWFELYLRSPNKFAEMNQAAHEVARKTLNLEDVRRMTIAVPPISEQSRIVEEADRVLSVASQQELAIEQTIQRAKHLRMAVLSMAFGQSRTGS